MRFKLLIGATVVALLGSCAKPQPIQVQRVVKPVQVVSTQATVDHSGNYVYQALPKEAYLEAGHSEQIKDDKQDKSDNEKLQKSQISSLDNKEKPTNMKANLVLI